MKHDRNLSDWINNINTEISKKEIGSDTEFKDFMINCLVKFPPVETTVYFIEVIIEQYSKGNENLNAEKVKEMFNEDFSENYKSLFQHQN